MGESKPPTGRQPLPPVDPERLDAAFRKVANAKKPPGGWPGKPPKEVRADDAEGDGA